MITWHSGLSSPLKFNDFGLQKILTFDKWKQSTNYYLRLCNNRSPFKDLEKNDKSKKKILVCTFNSNLNLSNAYKIHFCCAYIMKLKWKTVWNVSYFNKDSISQLNMFQMILNDKSLDVSDKSSNIWLEKKEISQSSKVPFNRYV